jgi:hypothetical protein
MSQLPVFSSTVVLAIIAIGLFRWQLSRTRVPLPPGPKGYPIIGNIFDVPKEKPQKSFAKMAKASLQVHISIDLTEYFDSQKFGDITYLNILGTNMLILNTQEAAVALLDKKGANYQNRPRIILGGEM